MANPRESEIRDHLLFFDLDVDSSMDDLDEKFNYHFNKAGEQEPSKSGRFESQRKEIEYAYNELILYFIMRDCEEGRYDRDIECLTWNNVQCRRYEPGVLQDPEYPYDEILASCNESSKRREETNNEPEEDQRVLGWREFLMKQYDSAQASSTPTRFSIVEVEGDILALAPDNAIIVHAVNCLGVWGSGFAAELKKRFPGAFEVYSKCCQSIKPENMIGWVLLIPPVKADYEKDGKRMHLRRWIACLFTSMGYGAPNKSGTNPGRMDEDAIVVHTNSALEGLKGEIMKIRQKEPGSIGGLHSPRFNSWSFRVPWVRTRETIENNFADYDGSWTVFSLAS